MLKCWLRQSLVSKFDEDQCCNLSKDDVWVNARALLLETKNPKKYKLNFADYAHSAKTENYEGVGWGVRVLKKKNLRM